MSKTKPDAEIDILYPDRVLTLAGESVTVRELAFAQTLRLQAEMAPLIRAFVELPAGDEGDLTGQFAALFGAHAQAWLGFMATACDKPRAWVEHLGDEDGQTLSMTVWAVNASFFTRRVLTAMIARRAAAPDSVPSIMASSTPH